MYTPLVVPGEPGVSRVDHAQRQAQWGGGGLSFSKEKASIVTEREAGVTTLQTALGDSADGP